MAHQQMLAAHKAAILYLAPSLQLGAAAAKRELLELAPAVLVAEVVARQILGLEPEEAGILRQ